MSDERPVRDTMRDLPESPATPEFRARLREEFVAGTLGGVAEAGVAGAKERRVVPMRIGGIGLALAAALMVLFFTFPRSPQWDVIGAAGEGTITVGEHTYPAGAATLLPPTLPPGTRIRVDGEAMLDLAAPGVIAIQMAGGSALELPGRAGRFGGPFTGTVLQGEVRFVTGPGFVGRRLEIAAPAARILVTGTTFAVITNADSTCVCVLEGTVTMDGVDGTSAPVVAGTRRTVFRQSGEVLEEPIFPMERMKLQMLRDSVTQRAAGARP